MKDLGADVTFFNVDLLKVSDDELRNYLGSTFVLLDATRVPYTQPFEIELFKRMVDVGFGGTVLVTGIDFNLEMKRWWKQLQLDASRLGYTTSDITRVGQWSGTGLVDFSGKVTVKHSPAATPWRSRTVVPERSVTRPSRIHSATVSGVTPPRRDARY